MVNSKIKEILARKNRNESVINSLYQLVIESENMNYYKNIIQTGAKLGQSLFSHIENMVGVTAINIDVLNLSNVEAKVLLTAIVIHDLNKVPDYSHYKSYLDITSDQDDAGNFINIIKECERVGIGTFFEGYREYLYDIRAILNAHSAHMSQNGEIYYCKSNTKLDKEIISKLINLIRAADCIDLSKDFYEENKKKQFLQHLNKVSIEEGKEFKLISHKFSDNRGDLSNMINSLIIEFMQEKKAIPLLLYPEGCFYLVDKSNNVENFCKENYIKDVVKKIKIKILDDLDKFIINKQAGIVVDEKAFEIESIAKIVWRINTKADELKVLKDESIIKKNNTINLSFDTAREKFQKIGSGMLEKEIKSFEDSISELKNKKEETDKKEIKDLNKLLKEQEKKLIVLKEELDVFLGYKKLLEIIGDEKFFLKINKEINSLSEFIRAMYSFINSYVTNKNSKLAWYELYKILELDNEEICYLNLVNKEPLYHRPYLIGELIFDQNKDEKREGLVEHFIKYFEENIVISSESKNDIWIDLERYIEKNVSFSFEKININSYRSCLEQYSDKQRTNCTLCGSDFEATDWMAIDIPKSLFKVQQFSNRINPGVREPKRKVCNICRIEYLLKKSTYSTKVEVSRRYMSIYPKGFCTMEKLNLFKESFSDFNKRDIKSIFFDVETSYCEVEENMIKIPKFSVQKVKGINVPKSKELIGNIITFPINFESKSVDTEIYIDSLMQVVYFNKYFDMRISVTEQPYMTNRMGIQEEVYIPSVPVVYSKLFDETFTKNQVEEVFKLFVDLFRLAKFLGESINFIYDMLRALNNGRYIFIYELYKNIKKLEGSKKKKRSAFPIKDIKPITDNILEYLKEEDKLTSLEKLAIYASDKKIFGGQGGGLKDNAITKPISIILDKIITADLGIRPIEDVRALTINEIQKYFERIYFGKLSNEKREDIEIYVNLFFDEIFKDSYQMNIRKLERDRREIPSIYVYYFKSYYESNKEEV